MKHAEPFPTGRRQIRHFHQQSAVVRQASAKRLQPFNGITEMFQNMRNTDQIETILRPVFFGKNAYLFL
jgi:hypothetical protein